MENQKTLTGESTNKDVVKSITGNKVNERIKAYYNQLIGNIRGTSRSEILPFRKNAGKVQGLYKQEEKGSKMDTEDNTSDIPQANRRYKTSGISPPLNNWSPLIDLDLVEMENDLARQGLEFTEKGKAKIFDYYNRTLRDDSPTLSTMKCHYYNFQVIEPKMWDAYNKKIREECPTLTDPCHNSIRVITQDRNELREHKVEGEVPVLKSRMGTGGNNVPMVSSCITANYGKGPTNNPKERTMVMSLHPRTGNPKQGGTGTICKENETYCVDTGNMQGIKQGKLRRLTPRECNFLQGFPKDWDRWGTSIINLETYNKDNGEKEKTNTIKILSLLQETISENNREGWRFTKLITLLKEKVLQSGMYEIGLQKCMEEKKGFRKTRELQSKTIDYCNKLLNLWESEKFRYSPQKQKDIGQLIKKFISSLQKLSFEITQERGQLEQGESFKKKERLFGKIHLISDTQRYKLMGNAVTINVIKAIGEKLNG